MWQLKQKRIDFPFDFLLLPFKSRVRRSPSTLSEKEQKLCAVRAHFHHSRVVLVVLFVLSVYFFQEVKIICFHFIPGTLEVLDDMIKGNNWSFLLSDWLKGPVNTSVWVKKSTHVQENKDISFPTGTPPCPPFPLRAQAKGWRKEAEQRNRYRRWPETTVFLRLLVPFDWQIYDKRLTVRHSSHSSALGGSSSHLLRKGAGWKVSQSPQGFSLPAIFGFWLFLVGIRQNISYHNIFFVCVYFYSISRLLELPWPGQGC